MENIAQLFADLYNRFLLRDFVGKIVPGGVLALSVASMFWSPQDIWKVLSKLTVAAGVFLAGLIWIVTLGNQSVAEWAGLWSYFPMGDTPKDFMTSTLRIVEFQHCASDVERTQYERFVVIKEACGNLCVALLLSAPAWLVLGIRPVVRSTRWWEWVRLSMVSVLGAISVFGLYRMHLQHVDRQYQYADGVASLHGRLPQCVPAFPPDPEAKDKK